MQKETLAVKAALSLNEAIKRYLKQVREARASAPNAKRAREPQVEIFY